MKKLFKRIAPIVLALVMVLGSCLTVSAADLPIYNDATITDQCKSDYSAYIAYLKDSDIDIPEYQVYDSKSRQIAFYNVQPYYNGNIYSFQCADGFILSGVGSGSIVKTVPKSNDPVWRCSIRMCVANFDVLNSTNDAYFVKKDTTGFFPTPPPLVAAVQGAAPEEALKEVILLIPLSILFLAGCLGLRKGLRLLLTLLRQA